LVPDDEYGSNARPQIAWDDAAERKALIDRVARDGFGCLEVLHGRIVDEAVSQAGELLATVLGQDIEAGEDATFRIVWGVAPDRVIPRLIQEQVVVALEVLVQRARRVPGLVGDLPDGEPVAVGSLEQSRGDADQARTLVDRLAARRAEGPVDHPPGARGP